MVYRLIAEQIINGEKYDLDLVFLSFDLAIKYINFHELTVIILERMTPEEYKELIKTQEIN